MSSTATRRRAAAAAAPALSPADAAWLAAVPCALLTLLLVLAIGPAVGSLLPASSPGDFFAIAQLMLRPEPDEQGRFLVALAGPLLLAGATALLVRRPPQLSPTTVAQLALIAQGVVVAAAIAALAVQYGLEFGVEYQAPEPFHQRYFTPATLVAAVAGAAAIVLLLRSERTRALLVRWTRETPARRIGWTAAAVALVVVWLLHAFNTEATIADANFAASYHLPYTLDETYAVLNGRSPLVDFTAQYGSLLPYLVAGAMALTSPSVGVFSAVMCVLSGLALLAMYGVLRRVTRSSLAALVLFAPFVATSFFLLRGPLENRYTLATIFADYPLRFAGPWLLAWLAARQLDRPQEARSTRAWPLFLLAGLVAMNNTDHGVPALAAVVAALLWGCWPLTVARLRALTLNAAGGLLGAFALVSLLTLVRAGALPDPALMVRFARLFAGDGFAMLPMPAFGLHTILYLTFAAGLAVATVRALAAARGATGDDAGREAALTGALAFSAIFGLVSGSYYAGRSHPEVLVTSFAIWSFTLALLTVVVVRRLVANPTRWPEPAAAACLVAFCLAVCSLAQTPTPWSQLDRLGKAGEATLRVPAGQSFVAANVEPGERVAILLTLGHRIAENVGIENVSPYTSAGAMPAREQLADTIAALRAEGGRKLFTFAPAEGTAIPDMHADLEGAGFTQAPGGPDAPFELWVDQR